MYVYDGGIAPARFLCVLIRTSQALVCSSRYNACCNTICVCCLSDLDISNLPYFGRFINRSTISIATLVSQRHYSH